MPSLGMNCWQSDASCRKTSITGLNQVSSANLEVAHITNSCSHGVASGASSFIGIVGKFFRLAVVLVAKEDEGAKE